MVYLFGPQKKKRHGVYLKCETCKKEFYVYPSYIRRANKKNISIRFCSMKCYDKTGKNNPFWGNNHSVKSIKKMKLHPNRPVFKTGKNNPNFVRFGEEYGFSGSNFLWWRKKLMREVGRCEMCGFNNKKILTLHHKDEDRKNNNRKNLLLLCWNCHALYHYKNKSGMYHFLKNKKI